MADQGVPVVGQIIRGKYRVIDVLGRGGMGVVLLAEHLHLRERVAIKVLKSAASGAEDRLLAEARSTFRLRSEHTVRVHDFGMTEAGTPYVAMEYLEGRDLARVLHEDGPLGAAAAADYAAQACESLEEAHAKGIVHRDIKPSNLFLTLRHDGAAHVKVCDFGLAKLKNPDDWGTSPPAHTGSEQVLGTLRYMSPEQLKSSARVDGRSDLWSLGVTLFELLTGELPFVSDGPGGLVLAISSEPARAVGDARADVPAGLCAVVARCLEKDPNKRYSDAAEMGRALREVLVEAGRDDGRGVAGIPAGRDGGARAGAARVEEGASPGGEEGNRAGLEGGISDAVAVRGGERVRGLSDTVLAEKPEVAERGGPGRALPVGSQSGSSAGALVADRERGERASSGSARRPGRWIAAVAAVLFVGAVSVGGWMFFLRGKGDSGATGAAGATGSAAGAAAPLLVTGLACGPAVIEGEPADSDFARAIGIGACARLAIDLGVEWEAPGAPQRLDVTAKVEGGAARVTLAVGGRSATGVGETPLAAVNKAVEALGHELTGPVCTPAEVAHWGAKDPEGARRVKRLWRRYNLRLFWNRIQAEIDEVGAYDPGNPWPHIIAAPHAHVSSDARKVAIAGALAGLDRLTGELRDAARGYLMTLEPGFDVQAARGLLWQAYSRDPEDAEVAVLCSLGLMRVSPPGESLPVVERVASKAGTRAFVALNASMDSFEREPKLMLGWVARMTTAFPEALLWLDRANALIAAKQLDGVDAQLALARRLGGVDESSPAVEARLALARLDPERAREPATRVIANHDPTSSAFGVRLALAALRMEGRLSEARSWSAQEIQRQRELGNPRAGVRVLVAQLEDERTLGRPPGDPEVLAWAEKILPEIYAAAPGTLSARQAEVALARMRASPSKAGVSGKTVLEEIEKRILDTSKKDEILATDMRLGTIALVRAVRGDRPAAELWRAGGHAALQTRTHAALDAGLALEAVGDRAGAVEAYLQLAHTQDMEEDPLRAIVARVKLAALYRKMRRGAEAEALESVARRVWAKADKGVAEGARGLE